MAEEEVLRCTKKNQITVPSGTKSGPDLAPSAADLRSDASRGIYTVKSLARRGALNGLMAELIEGHLRFHVLDPAQKTHPSQLEAADELMAVVKRYLN